MGKSRAKYIVYDIGYYNYHISYIIPRSEYMDEYPIFIVYSLPRFFLSLGPSILPIYRLEH